ncbi:hypothetical protein AC626_17245 [Pseudoalteromonas rubra]|uniref:Uncharacterized protein n=1 Tax=Pseudoalteromonas rubra TaxID=43658 RepID=A0A0L0EPI8_9GAMM|nr:hypothetical protein AC626_17245 [Pseudoalteromonas rubra]
MLIKFADHTQSHYFPYDIAINGVLLDKLQQSYDSNAEENTFELTLTLHDLSTHSEANSENNSLTITVPYSLYDQQQPDQSWLDDHDLTAPATVNTPAINQKAANYAPNTDSQGISGLLSNSDTLWAFEILVIHMVISLKLRSCPLSCPGYYSSPPMVAWHGPWPRAVLTCICSIKAPICFPPARLASPPVQTVQSPIQWGVFAGQQPDQRRRYRLCPG